MMLSWFKRRSTSPAQGSKALAKKEVKFLTYNVWSREDVAVYKRMEAISGLVHKHDPDVIFFQEVTPYIRSIFQSTWWWNDYNSSTVYTDRQAPDKHQQDFCLLLSKFPLDNFASRKFADGPAQLERPTPPAHMRFVERHAQARHTVAALGSGGAANVVLGGDMSWGDSVDGPFPLAAGWHDAWAVLRSGARALISGGDWTHDAAWNEDAGKFHGHFASFCTMRKRPDRFLCKLRDYRLGSIQLIGDHKIGSNLYVTRRADSFIDLKPSCHRGVVLTIVPK